MSANWLLLGLAGWALGLIVVLAIFKMSGDQDRRARHEERRRNPDSDVTITKVGDS